VTAQCKKASASEHGCANRSRCPEWAVTFARIRSLTEVYGANRITCRRLTPERAARLAAFRPKWISTQVRAKPRLGRWLKAQRGHCSGRNRRQITPTVGTSRDIYFIDFLRVIACFRRTVPVSQAAITNPLGLHMQPCFHAAKKYVGTGGWGRNSQCTRRT